MIGVPPPAPMGYYGMPPMGGMPTGVPMPMTGAMPYAGGRY